ncbi:hypothetical protein ACLMJK_006106 [Lecanora helva]
MQRLREKIVDSARAKSEQFTAIEIDAEIVRQQIDELEQQLHKHPEFGRTPAALGPAVLGRGLRIKALKRRLAELEEGAELNSQSRALLRRWLKIVDNAQKAQYDSSEIEEFLEQWRDLLDATENERRRQHQIEMKNLNLSWAFNGFNGKIKILRWLSKNMTRRLLVEKPIHFAQRTITGVLLKKIKKG